MNFLKNLQVIEKMIHLEALDICKPLIDFYKHSCDLREGSYAPVSAAPAQTWEGHMDGCARRGPVIECPGSVIVGMLQPPHNRNRYPDVAPSQQASAHQFLFFHYSPQVWLPRLQAHHLLCCPDSSGAGAEHCPHLHSLFQIPHGCWGCQRPLPGPLPLPSHW